MKNLSAITIIFIAMSAQAADISDVPDYAPLKDLAVDTSIFLIHDWTAPADYEGETVKLPNSAPKRVDYYVEGKRVTRAEIPLGSTYCSVVSDGDRAGYTERSKRFSIASISDAVPAPRAGERGVGLRLKSILNSSIQAVSCYQAQSAVVPLTVRILRYMVRTTDDGTSLSLLAPPAADPSAIAANPARQPATYTIEKKDTAYDTIEQAHRKYVNYLKQASSNDAQTE